MALRAPGQRARGSARPPPAGARLGAGGGGRPADPDPAGRAARCAAPARRWTPGSSATWCWPWASPRAGWPTVSRWSPLRGRAGLALARRRPGRRRRLRRGGHAGRRWWRARRRGRAGVALGVRPRGAWREGRAAAGAEDRAGHGRLPGPAPGRRSWRGGWPMADVRTVRDVHVGTGISKTDLLDWGKLSAKQVAKDEPDAVVVFIGANEGFPMPGARGRKVQCCGPDWAAAYATRVRQMMRAYRQDGSGAGVLADAALPARASPARRSRGAVNAAIEVAAGPFRAQVRPLDMVPVFTPDGRYRDAIEADGRKRVVRDPDGIHLERRGRIGGRRRGRAGDPEGLRHPLAIPGHRWVWCAAMRTGRGCSRIFVALACLAAAPAHRPGAGAAVGLAEGPRLHRAERLGPRGRPAPGRRVLARDLRARHAGRPRGRCLRGAR